MAARVVEGAKEVAEIVVVSRVAVCWAEVAVGREVVATVAVE